MSQTEISNYVSSLGVTPIENERNAIQPYELDIYLPDHKIAIEYHGDFYHSYSRTETKKQMLYHKLKADVSETNNIDLIQIFEHEWKSKKEIIKSIISHKLKKSTKINAKRCLVQKIKAKNYNDFSSKNSIFGTKKPYIAYGLYFDNRLIAVMSFLCRSTHEWEIIDYVPLKKHMIVGGVGKLLKAFLKDYNPISVTTVIDRRYYTGHSYKLLGFKQESILKPNYWYVHKKRKIPKEQCSKNKILSILKYYDHRKTEVENLFANNYRRSWDAGHIKLRLAYSTKDTL